MSKGMTLSERDIFKHSWQKKKHTRTHWTCAQLPWCVSCTHQSGHYPHWDMGAAGPQQTPCWTHPLPSPAWQQIMASAVSMETWPHNTNLQHKNSYCMYTCVYTSLRVCVCVCARAKHPLLLLLCHWITKNWRTLHPDFFVFWNPGMNT